MTSGSTIVPEQAGSLARHFGMHNTLFSKDCNNNVWKEGDL